MKFRRAKRTKRAELLRALSNQSRSLLSIASTQSKLDQNLLDEVHLATRAIHILEAQTESDHSRNRVVDKEGRELRGFINQIEERIQTLAQEYADGIATQKNRAAIFGKSADRGAAQASISPETAAAK